MEYEQNPNHCNSPSEVRVVMAEENLNMSGITTGEVVVQGFCPVFKQTVPYSVELVDVVPVSTWCLQRYCIHNDTLNN